MSMLTPTSTSAYSSSSACDLASPVSRQDASLAGSVVEPCSVATEGSLAYRCKRVMDIAGASVALLFLTPIMLLIAVLIRVDSGGPILFRQARRGYRGRSFMVLKFRTMVPDAERRLKDLEESNESAGGVLFKLKNDPRVTRLGSFLRRYSLDELPQFINVLRGEMSLVGPRPLQLRDSDLLEEKHPESYHCRLQVLPGITGPWQVGGRSDVDYSRMVDLDLEYVRNWSIGRDLSILLKTFGVVILRRGAY